MAKRWFPGTVFGFCSGTLLVIGLTSLRTDHPAIGKQASWTQPATYDARDARDDEVNPWLEMEDETGNDLAETDHVAGTTVFEEKAAQVAFGKSAEGAENRITGPNRAAACPVEEFFAQISEFRYRYLFRGRDELGFFAAESYRSVAADDEPASLPQAMPELVFEGTEDVQTDAELYGFYEEYGPGERFSAAESWVDGTAEAAPSWEVGEIADLNAVEEEVANEQAAVEPEDLSANWPEIADGDYRDYTDYETLYGGYYEEARPQDVVGRRPWIRRRSTRYDAAAAAGENVASDRSDVIAFPSLEDFGRVHREEDWEARVAEAWILARNDAIPPHNDNSQVAAEVRRRDEFAAITADGDDYAESAFGDDFAMFRDESLEPLYGDYGREMSGDVSLPIPEGDREEASPVWDTPMHGEPGEDFHWVESPEETTVEFPALPQLDSAAAGSRNFQTSGDDGWDLEKPGYSPASNPEDVSHIYLGDYRQSEKYRYFVYEDGYRGWRELNAALSEGNAPGSVRMEVVLPALMRAVNTLPRLLSRTAADARRSLAGSAARLLTRPRTAWTPESATVK